MTDLRFAAAAATLLLVPVAHAQDEDTPEQVVVTGTRVENRSALDSAVPVDVVVADILRNVGVTEVTQALSTVLPSYNFPRPGLNDGTDTVRPATLRGLSPDETLVLVNGKRRHSAALVNVNGSIGRGAAAADLNTIPAAMLQSIEVLRDGASAQYGSDAIAGVLNLRLREDREGGAAAVTYGAYDTSFDVLTGPTTPANAPWAAPSKLERNITDGNTVTASVWKGLPLGANGFVTLAAEYKNQAHTERGGYDARAQYPQVNGAPDPRELTFDRFNSWYGEPQVNQKSAFLNSGYDLAGGVKLYGWAGYQQRDARSAGFYRPAADARNVIQIYPNGFLPIIAPQVDDYSAAAGVKWSLANWDFDTALVYGRNTMDFTIENTLNRSLGTASKTQFDAGGFAYDQIVLNLSGVRGFDTGFASLLNVALGVEARRESYSISAGEPDSYRNGGVPLPNGLPSAPGSQVFPGFRPENVVDKSRTAVGAYVDVDQHFTAKLLGSAAVRAEHYSDFGSNVSGKLAGRFDFTDTFAVRGSVQNGFRAPSLQQQYFATTSTNLLGTSLVDVATFPTSAPIARALGAQPLDAEKSVSFSLGTVVRLGRLDITVDAYRVNIDDRIVLSENLTQANVVTFLKNQGFSSVGGVRFFINGVDTRTKGVDLALSYPLELGSAGRIGFAFAGNYNTTDVTRVPTTAPLAALSPSPVLFDRLNVLSFEEGNPKSKLAASATWTRTQWGATLRATRYGEVLSPDTATNATFANVAAGLRPNDVVLHPKTLVDLEARVTLAQRFKIALGAENLFDKYPDPNPAAVNATGTAAFSNYSPFGRSGRFLYSRMSLDF